jgi:hypothetical protein
MDNISAVEWLIEKMIINNYISKKQHDIANWLIEEAKEMEKEQNRIIDEISDSEIDAISVKYLPQIESYSRLLAFKLGCKFYREKLKTKNSLKIK